MVRRLVTRARSSRGAVDQSFIVRNDTLGHDQQQPWAAQNQIDLGRARYTSAISRRDGLRLELLDYRVDADTRTLCWQLHRGLQLEHVLHGQLKRQP